ncbi:conserved hypothetical protein [Talaromyces stipitatus ATCC 10500]|uniref:DUF7707 domain-containing protein n=1 Tax=Talaromyces stipitatus (strain ATCC 10500 / CBS 375.48 / QM 6759 / NRRL 1006) TaxID=441959 RepID=B8MF94_TALSN|nr:uncharacterized protein TSTA_013000 [Talaromyces stipitatus ATCC 10500]XP_002483428.1 uncharacterized protein TSTA_013000 [Talaromyces stipitatus ATCC 10500]EED16193.1 conserved hypothetical protein [Talaromyces stipitatus ATCC 10500]EED16194.1 conserved hypothetical protein [Talaromyces stipitatus ATCC 10500]
MLAQGVLYLAWMVSLAASQSIDPSTIPIATRDQWCSQQQTSCPLICLQLPNGTSDTQSNTCDPDTLDFSCVCNTGQSPNSTEYSQTIPYFICTAYNTQCQNNCSGASDCQAACVQNHPCGAQDPKRYNATTSAASGTGATATTTGSATTSGSGDVLITGFGTGSAAKSTGGSSAGSVGVVRPFLSEFGQVYGVFMVVAGLLGGFAVIL